MDPATVVLKYQKLAASSDRAGLELEARFEQPGFELVAWSSKSCSRRPGSPPPTPAP